MRLCTALLGGFAEEFDHDEFDIANGDAHHQFGLFKLFTLHTVSGFFMMFGWFGTVIRENQAGLYDNKQLDRSFRWGMCWFIFSEVMFFGAFFGALFYARVWSVPWLGGEGSGALSHILLWPNFNAHWPLLQNPDPHQ